MVHLERTVQSWCTIDFTSGSDAILLGAETLRGLYPVETISTVGRICAEVKFLLTCMFSWWRIAFQQLSLLLCVLFFCFSPGLSLINLVYQFSIQCLSIVLQAEKVFNQDLYYKRTVKYVGEPMTHLESIASSAVRSICFSYFNLCLMFAWETFFCLSMSYHNHELSWHWFFLSKLP
jgi:hypothetical protein